MKQTKLWVFAAILTICGATAVGTTCEDAHAQNAQNDWNALREQVQARYGENKKITDDNYDKSLAVRCVNGTFVGKREEGVIACKGIPLAGRQPVAACRKFAGRQDESAAALRRGEAGSDGL